MVTPKKIIMKDLELADKEIARLRKENKELEKKLMLTENDRDEREVKARDMMKENKIHRIELGMYQSLFKVEIEPYGCGVLEKVAEEDVEKAIKKYLNTNQK